MYYLIIPKRREKENENSSTFWYSCWCFFKQNIFDLLVNEINSDIKPECIIITGGLTYDGLLVQFEKAHEEISRLDCQNKIVIPGNHDYRHTGYLLFKKFFPSKIII